MRPKDYHSVVRVWAIGGPSPDQERQTLVCAEVYCQTGEESQTLLKKVEDCMNSIGPTTIHIGDSVIRDEAISFARIFSH